MDFKPEQQTLFDLPSQIAKLQFCKVSNDKRSKVFLNSGD